MLLFLALPLPSEIKIEQNVSKKKIMSHCLETVMTILIPFVFVVCSNLEKAKLMLICKRFEGACKKPEVATYTNYAGQHNKTHSGRLL